MKKDKLKCGGCGGETFTLVHVAPIGEHVLGGGGNGCRGSIHITCCSCKSSSVLRMEEPRMRIEWGKGDGVLTGGWARG